MVDRSYTLIKDDKGNYYYYIGSDGTKTFLTNAFMYFSFQNYLGEENRDYEVESNFQIYTGEYVMNELKNIIHNPKTEIIKYSDFVKEHEVEIIPLLHVIPLDAHVVSYSQNKFLKEDEAFDCDNGEIVNLVTKTRESLKEYLIKKESPKRELEKLMGENKLYWSDVLRIVNKAITPK